MESVGTERCERRFSLFRNPEIAPLGPKPSSIGCIGDVPLEAIGPVEPDGVIGTVRRLDQKAVPICPLGGYKSARFKSCQVIRSRRAKLSCPLFMRTWGEYKRRAPPSFQMASNALVQNEPSRVSRSISFIFCIYASGHKLVASSRSLNFCTLPLAVCG